MRAWDPSGVLNPGNLLPRQSPGGTSAASGGSPAGPFDLDEASLLATFSGELALDRAEALLESHGLTLGLTSRPEPSLDVARWIAQGLPGAADPWSDPVAQPIAGLTARLHRGGTLVIRPAPRRAVGPDLFALFAGAGERIGVVQTATLCVRRRGAPTARALPFAIERNPPLSQGERTAWERLVSELKG
jgi:alkyldihydroxyacetonephosphate synthase